MLSQNLKQRLVGAAVLIGIAVLVIPFLLQSPSGISLNGSAEAGNGAGNSTAEHGDSSRQGGETTFIPALPAPVFSDEAADSRAPGWMVQIGSFAHQDNALQMRDKAVSSGYKAFIKSLKKGTQIIYKVRIGPTRNLEHAKALKQTLERQWHIRAFLVSPTE